MRNRREWIFGCLTALLAATGLSAAEGGPGVLDVTYYYLPG
jgi:hypothetical protein